MIFNLHGKTLRVRIETRTFRNRPALQDPVELEAEIVVQPTCRVLLHHEQQGFAPTARCRTFGLGRLRKVAFAVIDGEPISHSLLPLRAAPAAAPQTANDASASAVRPHRASGATRKCPTNRFMPAEMPCRSRSRRTTDSLTTQLSCTTRRGPLMGAWPCQECGVTRKAINVPAAGGTSATTSSKSSGERRRRSRPPGASHDSFI